MSKPYTKTYFKEIDISDFDDRFPSAPVLVEFVVTVQPAEMDIGIFSPWIDDFYIEDTHLPTLPNGLGKEYGKEDHRRFNKYIEEMFEDEVIQDFIDA